MHVPSVSGREVSCEFDHAADGGCHALPFPRFDGELTAARRGEVVILGAAAQLRYFPLGLDPALVLEAMEGRIERALVDLQDVSRNLLDTLGDGPAVQGILLQRAQDQQSERAGEQIWRSRHGVDSRHYKRLVSAVNTKPACDETSMPSRRFQRPCLAAPVAENRSRCAYRVKAHRFGRPVQTPSRAKRWP